MPEVIRAAFTPPDRRRWTGGYQYFLNMFRVLGRYGNGTVHPVAFVGEDLQGEQLVPFRECGVEVVRNNAFDQAKNGTRMKKALVAGRDSAALSLYRSEEVAVVFESARWHGWRFPLPTIAWLPDFQHRRLPGMFGRLAWLKRELGFQAQVASARAVMLSSEAARADCVELYPASRRKIAVVPFAVEPGAEAYSVSESEVRTRYAIGEPYFYMPNQFWLHKNHTLIIEALRILRDERAPVTVIASGSQVDERRPDLVDSLLRQVKQAGLEQYFRVLQLVPRADVYALMRGSIALLNPSLFEGWSTTVEEAKALGVPLVVSDLAVHREQVGDCAFYFEPNSAPLAAAALRRATAELMNRATPAPDQLQARQRERLQEYAHKVEALIARAADEHATSGVAHGEVGS